jgi:dTDP-4-amino-4,6-dideoxygalactose transaminase
MLNTKFSPWPDYSKEEAKEIQKVLLSNKVNYWTGQECREFEKEFALWTGTKYAIALGNGTIALDAALKAINISPGDEVIVTSRSFIASVSSIINAGGIPIFADVDVNSQNITASSIRKKITNKSKAIICVHLAGWPCEMDDIMHLSKEFDLCVIEDCAQAHGAVYKERSVGSIGHIGCWSFCQDKIMTTGGEGGMITTNNKSLWSFIWSYKDHGKSYEAVYSKKHSDGFRYLHESFGTNWRMNELQAAIGRIQLSRMSNWHSKRLANANRIWEVARRYKGLRVPIIEKHIVHAAYKCYIFVDNKNLNHKWDRNRIVKEINELDVPCYWGSCSEIYLEKAFENTSFRPKRRLKNAQKLGEESIMFLVHPSLKEVEIQKTCDVLSSVMNLACD